jgi:homoserine/homoserine lactone efflux protein
VVLTATVVVIDILVMWFFFAAAAKSFQRFTHNARGQTILNRVFGILFVAVGILLALIH